MIWLSVRLLTRAWGVILAGLIVAGVGGALFPSHSGATVTPGYARGCIEEAVLTPDGATHEFQLGQLASGACKDDPNQSAIGYRFTTSSLTPAFPQTLRGTGVSFLEMWYQPDLSSGTCGPSDAQRSCQVATVVAVRAYSEDSVGNLVAGALYQAKGFTIGAGDLTRQNYAPENATYTSDSPILPISLIAAGLLVLGAGLLWLALSRKSKRGGVALPSGQRRTTASAQMSSPAGGASQPGYAQPTVGAYSQPTYQQPTYAQPNYPQPPGYSQPPYPQQQRGRRPGQRP